MTWSRVLVGIDGSEGSRRALRYAADEAEAHGAELMVLLAYSIPAPPVAIGLAQPPWRSEQAWRDDAEHLLQQTVAETIGNETDLTITAEAVEGPAAQALIDASGAADLLVVGTRGHGGFAGMLLGSVSQHLAAHATCTVAVFR